MPVYLDTSALLKRYLPERNSDSFESYFRDVESAQISRLTLVELRSALARKRREGRFDTAKEAEALNEISTDIQDGLLTVFPASDLHFVAAFHLMGKLTELPLRTLDALHLATAQTLETDTLATADDVMRRAAEALGLNVVYFGD
jgi:predicted nucleic acid-binding protein